jgi:hypothetical protein
MDDGMEEAIASSLQSLEAESPGSRIAMEASAAGASQVAQGQSINQHRTSRSIERKHPIDI